MLTKLDMAKVIATATYNLPELVTEERWVAWQYAVRLSKLPKATLKEQYDVAMKVIQQKLSAQNSLPVF